jgi:hypothetical protein
VRWSGWGASERVGCSLQMRRGQQRARVSAIVPANASRDEKQGVAVARCSQNDGGNSVTWQGCVREVREHSGTAGDGGGCFVQTERWAAPVQGGEVVGQGGGGKGGVAAGAEKREANGSTGGVGSGCEGARTLRWAKLVPPPSAKGASSKQMGKICQTTSTNLAVCMKLASQSGCMCDGAPHLQSNNSPRTWHTRSCRSLQRNSGYYHVPSAPEPASDCRCCHPAAPTSAAGETSAGRSPRGGQGGQRWTRRWL